MDLRSPESSGSSCRGRTNRSARLDGEGRHHHASSPHRGVRTEARGLIGFVASRLGDGAVECGSLNASRKVPGKVNAVMQRCEAAQLVPTNPKSLGAASAAAGSSDPWVSEALAKVVEVIFEAVAPLLGMGPPPIELDQVRSPATLSDRRTSPTSKP